MEYLDIVNEKGIPTGEIISREIAHQNGIRHRTAHIWVIREVNHRTEVLLQQRSFDKDCFPGLLDTSSAGHIQAGDMPLDSALRELKEELGINAEKNDLTFIGTFPILYEREFHNRLFKDNEISNVFLYEKEIDIQKLTIQKEELEAIGWYDLNQTIEMVKNKNPEYCVPIEGIQLLKDFLEKRKNSV